MRTILIALGLIAILTTQSKAEEKKYRSKECEGISAAIDFLLSKTPEMWDQLKQNPNDEKTVLELICPVND
ncbi:MAG: hypothetical protein CL532_08405 [Aestuariivita sp.]|nr:hypothetical protein [Aestuariivita sp.]|tara:strand:+ start:1085 stop:1297 length:213 start_codon:yes stop_codon:yes gene_type:complete